MLDAALLAAVVLKLFFVDLGKTGGVERMVTFIAVGVLWLVVGYLAPVPPAAKSQPLQQSGRNHDEA